jgi:hypothetical protein
MKRLVLFIIIFLSFNVFAKKELFVDCKNYCAFSEFENNCHGVAFIKKKGDEADYLYTHYSKLRKACVYNFNKVSTKKIEKQCNCKPTAMTLPAKDEPMTKSSATQLRILRHQIKKWAACAPDPATIPVPADDQKPFSPKDQRSCQEMRAEGKKAYATLGGCFDGTFWNECKYYGNTNNVNGPACISGDEDMCLDIKKNQNSLTGAWYRNAYQKRFPFSETGQPLFSRDELLGIMLYFVKTKDKESARKWLVFLRDNPKKGLTGTGGIIKVHNICPPHPGPKPANLSDNQWKNMKADDRCEIRPNGWGQLYMVYKHIGFSNRELKNISKSIYKKMKRNKKLVIPTEFVSSLFVPRYSYQTALEATSILLFRAMGMGDNKVLNMTAKLINKRTGKDNPYYHYLAQGNKATEYGAYLIKKFCPVEQPDNVSPPQGGIASSAASFFDSSSRYFGGLKNSWQANLPTGHDCISWINFYLK